MELVDLYSEDRIPLGKTAERQEHRARESFEEFRVVVHICIFDSNGQLLI